MKNIAILSIAIFILSSCSNSDFLSNKGSMDWPLFRGDAALSGYTSTKLVDEPSLLWVFKTESRTVSSPIVYGGTTYWCDRKGYIRGVDIDGKLAFEYDLRTSVESTPMICDSVLYIGRIDGFMSAISLTKKDTLWNFETLGQVSASPNILKINKQEAIVFGSYDNLLYCVDRNSGKKISSFESGYYINGAVAMWNQHIIFGGCDSWVRIIDCSNNIITDSLQLDNYIPASPAVAGNFCYIGDYSGNVYELYIENGKITHNRKMLRADNDSGSLVSVPSISAQTVFVLSDDKMLHAINRKDGSEEWKYMLKGDVGESSPLVCNNKIIVCTKTGIVSILDSESGKLIWEYDTGEQIIGSPAVIKDYFFILSSKGNLFCFGKNNKTA